MPFLCGLDYSLPFDGQPDACHLLVSNVLCLRSLWSVVALFYRCNLVQRFMLDVIVGMYSKGTYPLRKLTSITCASDRPHNLTLPPKEFFARQLYKNIGLRFVSLIYLINDWLIDRNPLAGAMLVRWSATRAWWLFNLLCLALLI